MVMLCIAVAMIARTLFVNQDVRFLKINVVVNEVLARHMAAVRTMSQFRLRLNFLGRINPLQLRTIPKNVPSVVFLR